MSNTTAILFACGLVVFVGCSSAGVGTTAQQQPKELAVDGPSELLQCPRASSRCLSGSEDDPGRWVGDPSTAYWTAGDVDAGTPDGEAGDTNGDMGEATSHSDVDEAMIDGGWVEEDASSPCDRPLMNIDPVTYGLDATIADDIVNPTSVLPHHSRYELGSSFSDSDVIGIVLPEGGTLSPVASQTPDPRYSVSGCWGASGARVFAQTGLYTFLALSRPTISDEVHSNDALHGSSAVVAWPVIVAAALAPHRREPLWWPPAP